MRYLPSRKYAWAGLAVLTAAAATGWAALTWPLAAVACGVLLLLASLLILLGLQPSMEARDRYLRIGRRAIPWSDIREVRRTDWKLPTLLRLTTTRGRKVNVIFTGDPNSGASLLRQICRSSETATIDGRPYHEFWGEVPVAPPSRPAEPPAPAPSRLLRPEDEAEVERLYQRLKAVGRLDSGRGADES